MGNFSSFFQAIRFQTSTSTTLSSIAFDKINDSDFKPAIEEGMRVQLMEIEIIANNAKLPTFENTLVAM